MKLVEGYLLRQAHDVRPAKNLHYFQNLQLIARSRYLRNQSKTSRAFDMKLLALIKKNENMSIYLFSCRPKHIPVQFRYHSHDEFFIEIGRLYFNFFYLKYILVENVTHSSNK